MKYASQSWGNESPLKAINIQTLFISIFRQTVTWDLMCMYSKDQWAENAKLSLGFSLADPCICPSFCIPVLTSVSRPSIPLSSLPISSLFHSQTSEPKSSDAGSRFFSAAPLGHYFVSSDYLSFLWVTSQTSWNSAAPFKPYSLSKLHKETCRQAGGQIPGWRELSRGSLPWHIYFEGNL